MTTPSTKKEDGDVALGGYVDGNEAKPLLFAWGPVFALLGGCGRSHPRKLQDFLKHEFKV